MNRYNLPAPGPGPSRDYWSTVMGPSPNANMMFQNSQPLGYITSRPRPENQNVHKCPLCQMPFKRKKFLDKHYQREHMQGHVCPICAKSFARKYNLDQHVKTIHEKKKTYICKICNKAYSRSGTLKEHQQQIHKMTK